MRKKTAIFAQCLFIAWAAASGGCDDGANGSLEIENAGTFQGIVGGTETGYETFKGVMGLYYSIDATGGALCTATLIAPQVLLTAGHCVYYPGDGIDAVADPSKLMAIGGANVSGLGAIHYPNPVEVVINPAWTGEIGSDFSVVDLAMVKLESPVTTVETYRLRETDDVAQGDTGVIVGYGLLSSSEQNSAGIHRFGETTVKNKVSHYLNLGDPTGTCQGDSGGPFFTKIDGDDYWHLTGVTSLGLSSTCDATNGSVDENVAQQLDWIDETMNAFVGYGIADVPHQDPPDADAGTDADADTDADTDADADGDAGADGGAPSSSGDDGCAMIPRATGAATLLSTVF